ncbi:MAG: hypothetical protein V2I97_23190 [Desulfococcaceae bacterium]|nr:hypothetical protein [Desulfococcaceae bacterium]
MRKKRKKEDNNTEDTDEFIIFTRSARKNQKKRTCRMCGKDPYPNYFYCPACHHRVSHSGHNEEHKDFAERESV